MNIEEVKKRLHDVTTEQFNLGAEMDAEHEFKTNAQSDMAYLLSVIEKYEYEDKVKWIERLLNERLVILSEKRLDSAEVEGRCKELELTLQAIRGSE